MTYAESEKRRDDARAAVVDAVVQDAIDRIDRLGEPLDADAKWELASGIFDREYERFGDAKQDVFRKMVERFPDIETD